MRNIVIAALAALAAAVLLAPPAGAVDVGQSGWAWGAPRPQGNDLYAIGFAGAARGYAVGDFGTVLITDDAGASWTAIPTGRVAPNSLLSVLGPDSFVAGGGCALRRSDDAGKTLTRLQFTARESDCASPLADVAFATPQIGTLLLADGTVLRTDDGGATFSRRTALPGRALRIVPVSPDAAFALASVDGRGRVLRTTDAAATWKDVFDTPLRVNDLAVAPGGAVFATAGNGTLLRSVDSGDSWERMPLDGARTEQELGDVRCGAGGRCLILNVFGDRMIRTEDGGETATTIEIPGGPLHAIAWAGADRAAAVGHRGLTLLSADAGKTFAPVGAELPGRYLKIRASSRDLAAAAGAGGAFARTTDGGLTWTAGAVSTSAGIVDVSFVSAGVGFALDTGGTLLRTDNGGNSWRILDVGPGGAAEAVIAPSERTVLAVGPRGIRRSGNGGANFDTVPGVRLRRAALDHIDRAGSALLAYGRRALFVSTSGGRRWRAVKRPGRRTVVDTADFVSPRVGFLLDDTGRVFATRSGGRRWRRLLAAGGAPVEGLSFSSSRAGWLVLAGFPRPSGRGWLLRTDDGGRTFRPQLVSDTTLSARTDGTPTLAATGARTGIVFSPGRFETDNSYDGGGGAFLTGPQSFFATARGGDSGRATRLTVRAPRRVRRGRGARVAGRLSGARGGEEVTLWLRAGRGSWRMHSARVTSPGRFSLALKPRRATRIVAHWPGDGERAPAGTRVRIVRVR